MKLVLTDTRVKEFNTSYVFVTEYSHYTDYVYKPPGPVLSSQRAHRHTRRTVLCG